MPFINEGPWPPEQLPQHGQLADANDDLDWNVDRDGRMRDHATITEDAEPTTVSWEG